MRTEVKNEVTVPLKELTKHLTGTQRALNGHLTGHLTGTQRALNGQLRVPISKKTVDGSLHGSLNGARNGALNGHPLVTCTLNVLLNGSLNG